MQISLPNPSQECLKLAESVTAANTVYFGLDMPRVITAQNLSQRSFASVFCSYLTTRDVRSHHLQLHARLFTLAAYDINISHISRHYRLLFLAAHTAHDLHR